MRSSLAARTFLAVLLMIGFYIFAIAIALGLLYIPYAQHHYQGQASSQVAILCVVGAIVILYSIVPRPNRFADPGPRLKPEEHPDLFQEIQSIAVATGQKMPSEVYLVNQVNAWVTQRGGFLGLGSRRVMVIGLPLIESLSLPQFRAVILHEFGHYYGGDTKLGPLIYKTREAIDRTMLELGRQGTGMQKPFLSMLQKPFELYGKMFLRITHAISREQEFSADLLAARIAGPQSLAEGLQAVHKAGVAFNAYFINELLPPLMAGYRPPIAEGFRRFTHSSEIAKLIDQEIKSELEEGKTDPLDTHPPLKERISAIAHLPQKDPSGITQHALSLIGNIEETERHLVLFISGEENSKKMKR